MMFTALHTILLLAMAVGNAFAAPVHAGDSELPAALGSRLPASFRGEVKHQRGGATHWVINLWPDHRFQYSMRPRRVVDAEHRIDGFGRWRYDHKSGLLTLDHGREKPVFLRTGGDRLQWADPDAPGDAGAFVSAGPLQELELRGLLLSGMMVYLADAAVITLCQDGASYPVAMEGDYLALERAYLADRPGPGEALRVFFEGELAYREPMEGPRRQMAVVDQFLRTAPDTACPRPAHASR